MNALLNTDTRAAIVENLDRRENFRASCRHESHKSYIVWGLVVAIYADMYVQSRLSNLGFYSLYLQHLQATCLSLLHVFSIALLIAYVYLGLFCKQTSINHTQLKEDAHNYTSYYADPGSFRVVHVNSLTKCIYLIPSGITPKLKNRARIKMRVRSEDTLISVRMRSVNPEQAMQLISNRLLLSLQNVQY